MATWHQARTGPIQPDAVEWLIVDDPPGDMRSAYGCTSEQDAKERLRIWAANGRNVQHCYILPPKGELSR